jgi:uncharacterized protein
LRHYLDANVILPLFVPEPTSAALSDWFAACDELPCIADLTFTECCAAISRRVRIGELTGDDARLVLVTLDEWVAEAAERIATTRADILEAAQLVRKPLPKLLAPDAIHLATCKRLGLTLVSNDAALLEIAAREGVEAFGIDK